MKRAIIVLALTKMRSGFCLAGIEPSTGRWIRPVKEFGSLRSNDLHGAEKEHLTAYDRIELTLDRPRPQPPHIEDWVCDFVRHAPQRLDKLEGDERAAFLEQFAESDVSEVLIRHERSLILAEVSDILADFHVDTATRKMDTRLICPMLGLTTPVPVTDLRWRALCRARNLRTDVHRLDWPRIRDELGVERAFLALGLSREHDGRIWPLVVGIHCVPDFEVEVDWREP